MLIGGAFLSWAVYDAVKDDDEQDSDQDLNGGSGDDEIQGGFGNDALNGAAGDDLLNGNAGDDAVRGDEGDDIGIGGAGDDILRGAAGDDLLSGGDGDDTMFGDTGDDWLEGGDGDDSMTGDANEDILIGNAGADTLDGGGGADALFGGDFLERELTEDELVDLRAALQADLPPDFPDDAMPAIFDDGEADELNGGAGNDLLFVGDGDTATGGDGDDLFYLLDGEDTDPAVVTDFENADDALIYVYQAGGPAPTLDLIDNANGTQTLTADGDAVATIAATTALTVGDILLYERESSTGIL